MAFGTDFAKQWNSNNLGLKRAKGDGTISFLINHAFKGLDVHIRYPWFQVHGHFLFKDVDHTIML